MCSYYSYSTLEQLQDSHDLEKKILPEKNKCKIIELH